MPFLSQGKTNWKYILIIVILAVTVDGGILLFTVEKENKFPEVKPLVKTKEKTANWETYDNEVYGGYKIAYPDNWYLTYSYKNFAVISSLAMDQRNYGFKPLSEGNGEIIIDTLYKSNSLTLDEWTLATGLDPRIQTRNKVSYSDTEIAGIKGKELIYSAPDDKQIGRIVFVPKEEFTEDSQVVIMINLYYFANDPRIDYYNQVFDQILSNFKFLE